MSRRARTLVSLCLLLGACADPPAAAPAPAATSASPESPSAPQAPQPARYTLNEWGLIGVEAGALTARIGNGVSHPPSPAPSLEALGAHVGDDPSVGGLGLTSTGLGHGGKPVIYLHVPQGAPPVDVSVGVRLPAGGLLEHWPPGSVSDEGVTWNVRATAGSCRRPAAPPTHDAPACREVRDGFCEAAEIPRYTGHDDTCLSVGSTDANLLFYRGEGVDVSLLPLELRASGASWVVTRRGEIPVEGPVLFIERGEGEPRIHTLTGPDYALPTSAEGAITPDVARRLLHDEALRRGLLREEADAFVDAWTPAYFGTCERQGPVAAGSPPAALAEANRSLLYFASDALVDHMLPLQLTPRPEALHRVFLVRYVDPASVVAATPPPGTQFLGGQPVHGAPELARSARPPRVAPERPTVEGPLSAEVVRRIVLRHSGQVRACYESTLARHPETAGSVRIAFVVSPNGAVANAAVDRNTTEQTELGVCTARVFMRMVFPAADAITRVHYGFELSVP